MVSSGDLGDGVFQPHDTGHTCKSPFLALNDLEAGIDGWFVELGPALNNWDIMRNQSLDVSGIS